MNMKVAQKDKKAAEEQLQEQIKPKMEANREQRWSVEGEKRYNLKTKRYWCKMKCKTEEEIKAQQEGIEEETDESSLGLDEVRI